MGLLAEGEPLDISETKPLIEKLKEAGIEQFIKLYDKVKSREHDSLKWGEEIEYMLVKFHPDEKRVRLALRATEILRLLIQKNIIEEEKSNVDWKPEFADFMIEGSPRYPYGSDLHCFPQLEEDLRRRRCDVAKILDKDEHLMTMPCFPRVGCPNFTSPPASPNPKSRYCKSIFFPDEAVCCMYPRYGILARTVRKRRGSNTVINVPIFHDENTPEPFREDFSKFGASGTEVQSEAKDDHIFMNSLGGGHSCCGLQVTLQANNMEEARYLYDQLTPLTPIMLALSAGTPIFRGYLTDWDTRWNILSDGADDRTEEERGLRPLNEQRFRIPKTRHGTTDCYVHPDSQAYNDIEVQYDPKHFQRLIDAGIDQSLAQHIAHLFIRDPMQVFRESIDKIDEKIDGDGETEFFEDIQSSNWNNMRFKPPPSSDPEIGWRVEFRPLEPQLTDFENSAYLCFIILLTRVILSMRLSLLIPISKIDENIIKASYRDAVLNEKFFFRRVLQQGKAASMSHEQNGTEKWEQRCQNGETAGGMDVPVDSYAEMTINEIINGQPPDVPGLLPMIHQYLDSVEVDLDTRRKIDQYLALIQGRANGGLWTLAKFMREFVSNHPDYRKDSVVTDEICYDLMTTLKDIAEERSRCPKLNGVE